MYLRRTQRRRKDGSVVGYVQLAHNRRVDGVTRAEVLLNLGREDELDMDGLRRLAASIVRFTEGTAQPRRWARAAPALRSWMTCCGSTAHAHWAGCGCWTRCGAGSGFPEALAGVLGARRFSTDVERVLFAMVANRALDPCSKLACSEWAIEDVAIDGLAEIDEDHCYRAMDLLVEADTEGHVQEAVFFACSDLLNLEVDLLFFDTTSTYFERDEPERDRLGADGEVIDPAFRVYGHSKDHRPDLPQVVIGLAVTREGIPVRVCVWPGNTNRHVGRPGGQGRPARLAARPCRDRRRPRVLPAMRTSSI